MAQICMWGGGASPYTPSPFADHMYDDQELHQEKLGAMHYNDAGVSSLQSSVWYFKIQSFTH